MLWVGVVAPKDVPADRLSFLRQSLARIVKEPAFLREAQKVGVEVAYAPADEFEKQVREENLTFKELAKDLGLAPQ